MNETKTIPLTQGKIPVIDSEDFDSVSRFKWHADKKRKIWYAARNVLDALSGKRKVQYLHQFLLPGVVEVDHQDGNGLNNTRLNLRPATSSQNKANRKKCSTPKTSKFKGVSLCARDKAWRAYIRLDGVTKALGTFKTEVAAAKAYDAAARNLFGEFAC